jgi:hypothetical protein
MVLTSWGMLYGKDSNNRNIQIDADDNVFGYTNTWEFEYKKKYGDIRELCEQNFDFLNNNKTMYFICLDYDEIEIKKVDKKLYNEIRHRRKTYFTTVKDKIKIRKHDRQNSEFKSDLYEGQWVNGKKHGQGTMTYSDGISVYKGEWKYGFQDGLGIIKYADGISMYEGEWKNGIPNGLGKNKYANGDVYEGQWVNGMQNGLGKIKYANGDVYEGEWEYGIPKLVQLKRSISPLEPKSNKKSKSKRVKRVGKYKLS